MKNPSLSLLGGRFCLSQLKKVTQKLSKSFPEDTLTEVHNATLEDLITLREAVGKRMGE